MGHRQDVPYGYPMVVFFILIGAGKIGPTVVDELLLAIQG